MKRFTPALAILVIVAAAATGGVIRLGPLVTPVTGIGNGVFQTSPTRPPIMNITITFGSPLARDAYFIIYWFGTTVHVLDANLTEIASMDVKTVNPYTIRSVSAIARATNGFEQYAETWWWRSHRGSLFVVVKVPSDAINVTIMFYDVEAHYVSLSPTLYLDASNYQSITYYIVGSAPYKASDDMIILTNDNQNEAVLAYLGAVKPPHIIIADLMLIDYSDDNADGMMIGIWCSKIDHATPGGALGFDSSAGWCLGVAIDTWQNYEDPVRYALELKRWGNGVQSVDAYVDLGQQKVYEGWHEVLIGFRVDNTTTPLWFDGSVYTGFAGKPNPPEPTPYVCVGAGTGGSSDMHVIGRVYVFETNGYTPTVASVDFSFPPMVETTTVTSTTTLTTTETVTSTVTTTKTNTTTVTATKTVTSTTTTTTTTTVTTTVTNTTTVTQTVTVTNTTTTTVTSTVTSTTTSTVTVANATITSTATVTIWRAGLPERYKNLLPTLFLFIASCLALIMAVYDVTRGRPRIYTLVLLLIIIFTSIVGAATATEAVTEVREGAVFNVTKEPIPGVATVLSITVLLAIISMAIWSLGHMLHATR